MVLPVATLAGALLLANGDLRAETEEAKLLAAWDRVEAGALDEAEALLREVDDADTNEWMAFFDLEPYHWIARDYLEVIERRRAGDASDGLFRSPRFRFHSRGVDLSEPERARIAATYERTIDLVTDWAGEEAWTRTIFVEIAERFDSPSPARTLIFFWDRQERTPRTEVTTRVLGEEHLEVVLAHELTHAVLPHTCRPLAEGIANLAMKEIFPGRRLPLRRGPAGEPPPPWPLEELFLFNVRAQGAKVQAVYAAMRDGGDATLMREAYDNGDRFVALVDERWGREKLLDFYRRTNRDPAELDLFSAAERELAPRDELEALWREGPSASGGD